MRILAIDPGVHTLYCAFETSAASGPLLVTFAADILSFRGMCKAGWFRGYKLAIERPQIRSAARTNADPEDIAALRESVGRAIECATWGEVADVVAWYPNEWKGSVEKTMHNARVMSALRELGREPTRAALSKFAKSVRHNHIDAAGLWLYASGLTSRNGDLRR